MEQDRCTVQVLPETFYLPSASEVAPVLLGHWLVRRTPQGEMGGIIVETEAYISNDPACHAYRGESKRNKVMWGAPGSAYVYLIYGFHHCVNAVCCPKGTAEAVLIRAIEPTFGEEAMRQNRPVSNKSLTSGPGKLCAALSIDRACDGLDLVDADSPLIIAQNPGWKADRKRLGPVVTTPRIGISSAADWPLRFYLAKSQFLSRKHRDQ
jgi:DNA-3-methyladenine glycosylase